MSEQAGDSKPAPDAGGAPPTPPAADGAPPVGSPVAAPSPGAAAKAPDGEGEAEGGIDPQLVGLAVVLWLLAIGILVVKFPRLRIDWYLGNIKEASAALQVDEPSVEALTALAKTDPDALAALGEEVVGPLANRDEVYRSIVARIIGRVPGKASLDLLVQAADDWNGVVRGNVYVALGQRAQATPEEKAAAVPVLLRAVGQPGDTEPVARAVALGSLASLGAKEALWPAIVSLREARTEGEPRPDDPLATGELRLRTEGIAALRALAGKTEAELPYDPAAPLAARDAQVRALERWFEAQGGTIPAGARLDEVRPPASAAPVESATPPGGAR